MKRKLLLSFTLILVLVFLQACDIAPPPNESAQIGTIQWVTPLIPSPTPVRAIIGTPGVFIYPYSISHIDELGNPYIDIGDWLIATPTFPSFVINDSKLFECGGKVYMVLEVTNNGPYYFQYVHLGIGHGTEWFGVGNDENPFIFSDSACPVPPSPNWPSLWPGGTAYIYQEVHPNPAYSEYNIHLTMCAFLDAPDPCMYRYRLHVESWPTPTPTSNLIGPFHIHVIKQALCWVGPGPLYEVVNTQREGTELELLGIGEDDDFLIVLDPQYRRPCWLPRGSADEVPDEVLLKLEVFLIPLLPSPTPPNGQINGHVFYPNNTGIPNTRAILGPAGQCGTQGQPLATTSTNNNGRFIFSNLPGGEYCVTVPLPNRCKSWVNPVNGYYSVSLPQGGTINLDFSCQ